MDEWSGIQLHYLQSLEPRLWADIAARIPCGTAVTTPKWLTTWRPAVDASPIHGVRWPWPPPSGFPWAWIRCCTPPLVPRSRAPGKPLGAKPLGPNAGRVVGREERRNPARIGSHPSCPSLEAFGVLRQNHSTGHAEKLRSSHTPLASRVAFPEPGWAEPMHSSPESEVPSQPELKLPAMSQMHDSPK